MKSRHSSLPSAAGTTANFMPSPNHSGGFSGRRRGTSGFIAARWHAKARINASTSAASSGGSGASCGGDAGAMSRRPSGRSFAKTVRGQAAGAQIVPASMSQARRNRALGASVPGGRFAIPHPSIGRVASCAPHAVGMTPMMGGARVPAQRCARPNTKGAR